jgi:hypothetical protein
MNRLKGFVMLVLGPIALYQGWKIHTGQRALLGYGTGLLAIAMGIWRLNRKPPLPRA